MPESRRQQILAALQTRLQGIRRASGYQTDAGSLVVSRTLQLGPDDVLQAIVVVPGTSIFKFPSYQTLWPIEVQVLSTQASPDDEGWEEKVVADVIRAIETDDRTLNGLTDDDMRRTDIRVVLPEPGLPVAGVAITYEVPCRVNWGGL